MKTNIYQKLHKACCEASSVKKSEKVAGMKFNPLLADSVQSVAMEALLSNGLYPICNYENQVTDSFIMTTCHMKIYDVENPTDFVCISGTSALGNLDKFGSGNSMTYSKKYAFLNALNLKTGIVDEDGYDAKPFKSTKESQAKASGSINQTQPRAGEVDVEGIKTEFARAIHLPRLKYLKDTVYADQIKYLKTKNPNGFSVLKQEYENRMEQLSQN